MNHLIITNIIIIIIIIIINGQWCSGKRALLRTEMFRFEFHVQSYFRIFTLQPLPLNNGQDVEGAGLRLRNDICLVLRIIRNVEACFPACTLFTRLHFTCIRTPAGRGICVSENHTI